MHDVTVTAPGFCTPRMVMHMCLNDATSREQSVVERTRGVASGGILGKAWRHSRRFHYHRDPTGMYCLLDGERDLLRQSLLDLQPATEGLGYARELGEAEDELVGDVGDRNLHIVSMLRDASGDVRARGSGGRDRRGEEGKGRTLPVKGTRWCSQRLQTSISRTMTISS